MARNLKEAREKMMSRPEFLTEENLAEGITDPVLLPVLEKIRYESGGFRKRAIIQLQPEETNTLLQAYGEQSITEYALQEIFGKLLPDPIGNPQNTFWARVGEFWVDRETNTVYHAESDYNIRLLVQQGEFIEDGTSWQWKGYWD